MDITQPKVFISSTVNNMPSERRAAYNAVLKLNAFPVMCEFTMTAQNADSVTTCLRMVKESDIYVLILGGTFGWQPYGKESITELEYQAAIEHKIPVFIFNTTYPKDDMQKRFEARVNKIFWKVVNDAFELETEIEKSLKEEIGNKQNEFFNKQEYVYSNLVKVQFPQYIYLAELDIDRNEIKEFDKERGRYKKNPSLHDYAVSALYMKDISFPHDWILYENKILTFHDLQNPNIGLTKIIDHGTAERLNSNEYYALSRNNLSIFKYLLRKCLETKLHKLGIKWIKEEGLFAFIPIQRDDDGRWKSRKIQWLKTTKSATRTVVDIKRDLNDNNKIYNLKCLAFRSKFEYLNDNEWFLSLKPDWIYLWNNLNVCVLAYKNIQWLKKTERNMHVFNHFNFILKYLQPSGTSLFSQYGDYPFLTIGQIEKFNFAPVVPDDIWVNLEGQGDAKKLIDNNGSIGLFGL
jgi:hypothetical protein